MLLMALGPSNKCVINIFKLIDECVFFDKDVIHDPRLIQGFTDMPIDIVNTNLVQLVLGLFIF